MDWDRLLNEQRFCDERYQAEPHRPIYVQDADRITFSAAFRRLANKTQVHPLYENDHLHHRLIHSIETASVGRSLGMTIGHWLEDAHELHAGTKHTIAGTVQAACLAHDIGNPPFGHSANLRLGNGFRPTSMPNMEFSAKWTQTSEMNSKSLKATRKAFEFCLDSKCIEMRAA